jgi:hypothetical protein
VKTLWPNATLEYKFWVIGRRIGSRERCYDFKNIFAEKLAFYAQTTASFCKNLIITLVFEKKTPRFSPKIGKNRRKL